MAAYSNTVVTLNGVNVGTIQAAGGFLRFTNAGAVQFQGSQPIQVAHLANSYSFDSPPNGNGGSTEVLVPPAGHYLTTNFVFTLPNDGIGGDFPENYINVIVPQFAITNALVDGVAVASSNFVAIGTSGYSGATVPISASGLHIVAVGSLSGLRFTGSARVSPTDTPGA